MKNILPYIVARASEPSTWRGGVMLLTALGVTVSPDLMAQIIAVGTAVAGLVGVLTKDK